MALDESDETGASTEDVSRTAGATQETDLSHSKQALVSGRRKPTSHALQTTLQGGRAHSTDEITFSMRVRSMYEHGTEDAAKWVSSMGRAANGRSASTRERTGKDTPGNSTPTSKLLPAPLSLDKIRAADGRGSPKLPSGKTTNKYYTKEAHELAGGIEDWGEIEGQEVDRYGFIVPARRSDSRSSGTNDPVTGNAQRVATSLRVEAEKPRKSSRAASSARSARSVPPRPSRDWALRKGPSSVHSTRSTATSGRSNPFRSRHQRILDEASDMLTLPPGLADIAEQDDAGRTASSMKQREWNREQKWQRMARPVSGRVHGKGGGMRFDFDTSDPKLIERTWKGIPDRWRATAWHSFLATSAAKRGSPASDAELIGQFHKLQSQDSADDSQIDVDVPRTISMHIMFRRRYRGGQRLLFRVLHAVSLYFPGTGYVQGMASLAATLLCYYDEENAFVMIVRLWQLRGLEQLFAPGFGGLMAALAEFEKSWLGGGQVAEKLDELSITSTAYGTRWYLTLFNMSVPFPAQLRVWDQDPAQTTTTATTATSAAAPAPPPFGGADLDVLHATSAALIDATREILLDSDFENAMKVLTSFVPIRDEDLLMRVAKAEYKLAKKKQASSAASRKKKRDTI
ncbi:uncharacterized protein K489DRAFT_360935 [Dissoconium aciculare CBS 342.82]|uniref:Rab-GAP TBC domain-containing protein n=1 Tax=Dissoconium aciculare CBS 342.82 TaxID=1314786 RepID=A0A6J3LXX3_9PEZI|nr:uncharacterized protein K489DRAFT_360935 [Dissoconium aciculare CBS 342.82]KAF1820591.1 hypothetical protein K489DRAFT_360935 [Dissoconium aciculare CBS 342.82]